MVKENKWIVGESSSIFGSEFCIFIAAFDIVFPTPSTTPCGLRKDWALSEIRIPRVLVLAMEPSWHHFHSRNFRIYFSQPCLYLYNSYIFSGSILDLFKRAIRWHSSCGDRSMIWHMHHGLVWLYLQTLIKLFSRPRLCIEAWSH